MHTSVELQGSSPQGAFARGAVVPRVSLQTLILAVLRLELPPIPGAAPTGRVCQTQGAKKVNFSFEHSHGLAGTQLLQHKAN